MIRQMRYYIAVVETGSFSEAAEACHISQSAISQQIRALADHFVNEELGDQPLYAMLRQDSPRGRQNSVTMDDLREQLCIVVSSPEQRANEATYWRDVMTVQGDLLFVDSVEAACMNAVAGVGWLPCDHDMEAGPGTALVPLMRGEAPVTRKMFAFWLEERDSPLQWEFSAMLSRHFK